LIVLVRSLIGHPNRVSASLFTKSSRRVILDNEGVNPNPARDPRLKLPVSEEKEVIPPPAEHVLALLEHVKPERRLLFAFIERCGTRVGETCAWTWGDLDIESGRILSRPEAVKDRRAGGRPVGYRSPTSS
jgi:integrase